MAKYVEVISQSQVWWLDLLGEKNMILVTLGTQDKSFERLLKALDNLIDKKIIQEEVVVQAGYTNYESKNMKVFSYLPKEEFEKLIEECDLLITHAGVGSIMAGLKRKKKIIAIPRLAKYQEHTNDHQLQIAEEFEKEGYLLSVVDLKDLKKVLNKAKKFNPKEYHGNNQKMLDLIDTYITTNHKDNRILLYLILLVITCILLFIIFT